MLLGRSIEARTREGWAREGRHTWSRISLRQRRVKGMRSPWMDTEITSLVKSDRERQRHKYDSTDTWHLK